MRSLLPSLVLVFACLLACFRGERARGAESDTYFRKDGGVAAMSSGFALANWDGKQGLAWRTELDPGHSTPCVFGEKIFVTTYNGSELATEALDWRGHRLWRKVCPNTRIEAFHPTSSPACATPACDGERVYVFFGSFGLLAYGLDGSEAWRMEFAPFQDEFGSASSPILLDDSLILVEDHDLGSFVVAVDKQTGQERWRTPREGATRSYATPLAIGPPEKRRLLVAGALELTSYDPSNGKKLGALDGFARIVNTTPTLDSGLIYVATWSPGGDTDARIAMEPWDTARRQWDADGDGNLVRTEVSNPEVLDRFYRIDLNQDGGLDGQEWQAYARVFERAKNNLIALRADSIDSDRFSVVWEFAKGLPYVSSPVIYEGALFMVKDGGIMTSLDAAAGELLKSERLAGTGKYYASPVAADGHVLFASEDGVVTLVRAQKGKWKKVRSHDYEERLVATPVIVDGKMLIRTEAALYCYSSEDR